MTESAFAITLFSWINVPPQSHTSWQYMYVRTVEAKHGQACHSDTLGHEADLFSNRIGAPSQRYTSFQSPFGTWIYLKMPMGLINASSTLQWNMILYPAARSTTPTNYWNTSWSWATSASTWRDNRRHGKPLETRWIDDLCGKCYLRLTDSRYSDVKLTKAWLR